MMKFNRRQFLMLSGLSVFGMAGVLKSLRSQTAWSASPDPAILSQEIGLKEVLPATPPLLRSIAVADTGTGAEGQYAVAKTMNRYHQQNPFDLALLAGDNIYTDGEIEKIQAVFERPYQPLLKRGVKFHACLGNHDIRTDNGDRQVKYPGFNMSGRYYTFRRGPAQFFALDTNHNADWKNQLIWLDKELSQSDAPWKIVFGHHQIYSSGAYGLNKPFTKLLVPLFQKHNVQLYINGHEHHYERTRSIQGTTYLTCGAGAGVRPVGQSEWTEHSASKLSFAVLDFYQDRMFISGIDADNKVFDRGIVQVRPA